MCEGREGGRGEEGRGQVQAGHMYTCMQPSSLSTHTRVCIHMHKVSSKLIRVLGNG